MIAGLAGVSWGVLARNQKQLFSRNVLIGPGYRGPLLYCLAHDPASPCLDPWRYGFAL